MNETAVFVFSGAVSLIVASGSCLYGTIALRKWYSKSAE